MGFSSSVGPLRFFALPDFDLGFLTFFLHGAKQLIQCPRLDESILQLYTTNNKDAGGSAEAAAAATGANTATFANTAGTSGTQQPQAAAQLFVKSMSSAPASSDPDGFRQEKNSAGTRRRRRLLLFVAVVFVRLKIYF